jgi:hypothetical protein
MARSIEVDANKVDWTPTGRPGISRKLLRSDAATGARTVLLKLEANSRLPRHMHPAGEEVLVLEGRVRFEETYMTPATTSTRRPAARTTSTRTRARSCSWRCQSPTSTWNETIHGSAQPSRAGERLAVEQTAGSPSLAAGAHRGR